MCLLCTREGDILPRSDQGLYFHDMRYLSEQTLRLDGMPLVSLLASAGDGHRAVFELTNPDIPNEDGALRARKETLGIRREKLLGRAYVETLTVENFAFEPVDLHLRLVYAADFLDMFAVRGMDPVTRGTVHPAHWRGATLVFRYDAADHHARATRLRFSRPPDEHEGGSLAFHLRLKGREAWTLRVVAQIEDVSGSAIELHPSAEVGPGAKELRRAHQRSMGEGTSVTTDNELFNEVLARSFMDLHMLAMRQNDQAFFAAGVPWYVALFGRDSLVTAIQMAAFEPPMAEHTLRVLASYQATVEDDWRDAQPGKILHELRVGEMANLDEVPQTPYYGSVDSTPKFLILLGIHASWSGTVDLFHELRPNIQAALEWIDQYGDSDGDGFIDYHARSEKGLQNQGWKDSGNGIVMEDGSLARPPIALPEVQGDVYLAWRLVADLFERDGDLQTAARLRDRAQRLYDQFNREFWLPELGYYAFCRQADGSVAEKASSQLRVGDLCVVRPGQLIPGDGEVIEGIASVDESAITGESAPVIRESGGDRSSVTGGTRVLSTLA